MSVNRWLAASVVAAAAIGVPGSALAISSAAPGSKAATAHPVPVSKAAALSQFNALAASAGLTVGQLQSGLIATKEAGGNTAQGVAAFARATGVSPATARRIVASVFGAPADRSLTSASVTAALANELGVSTAAAHSALEQIGALSRSRGLDPADPAFAAIAHRLGVTPTRLAAALPLVKQAERAAAG
jgi:hypothetical protein